MHNSYRLVPRRCRMFRVLDNQLLHHVWFGFALTWFHYDVTLAFVHRNLNLDIENGMNTSKPGFGDQNLDIEVMISPPRPPPTTHHPRCMYLYMGAYIYIYIYVCVYVSGSSHSVVQGIVWLKMCIYI